MFSLWWNKLNWKCRIGNIWHQIRHLVVMEWRGWSSFWRLGYPRLEGIKGKKDDLVDFTLGSAVVQSASIQRLFIECPQGKAWFSLYRLLPQSTQRHVLLLFSGHSSKMPVLTCLMYRLLAADTEMGMRKSEEIFNIFGDNILKASIVFRLKSMYEYY